MQVLYINIQDCTQVKVRLEWIQVITAITAQVALKFPFFPKKIIPLLSLVLVTACQDSEEEYKERPVEELYNEALARINASEYTKAAKAFGEVERQHPYSNWALRAQLMSGYAYYQAKKYDEAIESLNVFIGLHPMHKDVAYAQYMIGICYYEQIPITERDQKVTEKAESAFKDVIAKYPDSSYARDAKIKLDLLRDHLAGKEMDVARFYQQETNHLAAINRFKFVVDNYQTTDQVQEALHRMVESYLHLGLVDQAKATAAVLGHNYPGSPWYQESYALINGKKPEESAQ